MLFQIADPIKCKFFFRHLFSRKNGSTWSNIFHKLFSLQNMTCTNFFTVLFPGNLLPSLFDSITTKIKKYYVNKIKKTTQTAVFAGFMNGMEPATSALTFSNVLHSRNYADIDSCELIVKIKEYLGAIKEMPVHVQLNLRHTTHAEFTEAFPFENFVVKGDIESDYNMNLTNLLKRTLAWFQQAAFHLTVLVRPSIAHDNPGSDQKIKVSTEDAKITVRYRRKGEQSFTIESFFYIQT